MQTNYSPKEKERILNLAKFADNPDIQQYQKILDLEEELKEATPYIQESIHEATLQISDDIKNIPQHKDYTEKLHTLENTLHEIQSKLEEELTVTLNII